VKIRIGLGREWQAGANAFNTTALKNLNVLAVTPGPSETTCVYLAKWRPARKRSTCTSWKTGEASRSVHVSDGGECEAGVKRKR